MASGRKPSIVVIGPIFVDMAIKCQHAPTPGKSVLGNALSYTLAGPGPNQAVEAALCGCDVHLISKVPRKQQSSILRKTQWPHRRRRCLRTSTRRLRISTLPTLQLPP